MSKRRRKKIPEHEIEAEIYKLSHEGRGITQIDNKTTFVFGALPEEKIKLKYTNIRSKFNEADATQILKKSPKRVEPQCQHFGLCGGCQLQHLASEEQIAHKQSVLLELLAQQGVTPETILPPLTAKHWGYRRKARIGAKFVPGKDKVLVGFRERGNSFVANLNQCEVLHPSIGHKLDALGKLLYELETRSNIPQLEIAIGDDEAAVILRHLKPLTQSDKKKLHAFCDENNLKLYLQPKGPETIRLSPNSNENTPSPFLHYGLPNFNLTFAFQPQQFTQINTEINRKMVDRAIELLEISPNDQVLDLFCGIGNFSLPMATAAKQVTGVEGDACAVTQARFNALANGLTNCDFITANLFEPIDQYQFAKASYNKILIDPPRTGALEILPAIQAWRPEKLLYISCSPNTLARDAKHLTESGYTLKCAGVLDMFPHTKHVEAMALFE